MPKVMQNAMVEGFWVVLLARGTDMAMNMLGASCSESLPKVLCV